MTCPNCAAAPTDPGFACGSTFSEQSTLCHQLQAAFERGRQSLMDHIARLCTCDDNGDCSACELVGD
jgi:hypothetical protein